MSHDGCDGQLNRVVVVIAQVPLSNPHCELAWQEAEKTTVRNQLFQEMSNLFLFLSFVQWAAVMTCL